MIEEKDETIKIEENTAENKDTDNLTNHEKKELKRQQKENERQQKQEVVAKKDFKNKGIKYGLVTLVILLILAGGYYFIVKPIRDFNPYYDKFYHWHANFKIAICGEEAKIRCGASMCGPMNFHHHNDDIMHMEGQSIAKEEDLEIGNFFEALDIPFTKTQILNMKNGDLCPNGNPGTTKMHVNGEESNLYEKYIPSRCEAQNIEEIKEECDKIEIKFE